MELTKLNRKSRIEIAVSNTMLNFYSKKYTKISRYQKGKCYNLALILAYLRVWTLPK